MNALLLTQYMHLEMVEMPVPAIGPDDVLVRVRACGICGSDVHGLDGRTGRRIPPLVMGHEAAGEVVEAGANVTRPEGRRPGHVRFHGLLRALFFCLRGEQNLCDNREVLGVSPGPYRRHGAFAEYVSVPRRIMYRLPENLSYEQAAMIEAVSVAVHAVGLTPIRLGDTAVVVGAGMIGLLTIQAARNAGCSRVITVDPDEGRLELALEAGATDSIKPEGGERGGSDPRADRRTGRGCGARMRGRAPSRSDGDRRGAQRRGGDAGGQCVAEDRIATAVGGVAADPTAGLVRFQRGIPGVHRFDVARRDHCGYADQRGGAAGRRRILVRPLVPPRGGPDEGDPAALMRTGDPTSPTDEDGGIAGICSEGQCLQIGACPECQLQVLVVFPVRVELTSVTPTPLSA